MEFRTWKHLCTAIAAVALTWSGTTLAITHGELDGDQHPAVVLLIMDVNGSPAWRCSGTLIAPQFVLTAGHCTGMPGVVSGIRIFTESDVQNGDNNYPFGGGNNTVEAAAWATHPDYPTASFVRNDVGMVKLAMPVTLDIGQYGQLPTLNSNDLIKSGRNFSSFTAVGYGLQRITSDPTGNAPYSGLRVRMRSNPWLIQSNVPGFTGDFSLLLSNNASTGGTCFGDSGGPNFIGNSMVIAGVTSFGLNGSCGGTGGVFRVDRQNVLDFINGFMANH